MSALPNPVEDPELGDEAAEELVKPVLRLIQGGLTEAAPEAGPEIIALGLTAPELVVAGAVVVGLIALGVYLYKNSQQNPAPTPPKSVQDCPKAPPAAAPAQTPAQNQTSEQDETLRKECEDKYQKYKAQQNKYASRSARVKEIKAKIASNKPVTAEEMSEFCDSLAEQIEIVKKELQGRKDYIDSGCDKFDWFNQGSTEEDRRKAHEGQVKQTQNQIDNLQKARQKYCSPQPPPSNPPPANNASPPTNPHSGPSIPLS